VTKRNIANIVAPIGVEEHEQQDVEESQERDPNLDRFVERVAEVVNDEE
jgi:hypothetical protein